MKIQKVDLPLFVSILLLVGVGFLIFLSASLGLLDRDQAYMSSIVAKQIYLGLIPGLVAMYAFSRIDVSKWRKLSFWIFIGAIALNLLVFVPGLGLSHGGATRWLLIGSFSLQVSEVLKIAAVIYFAAWLAYAKNRAHEWKMGFLPLVSMLFVVSALLLLQPDTDTLAIISVSLLAMYISAGGKWRHVAILAVAGLACLAVLAFTRPYIMSRITTFLDPAAQSQGAGYQIQQSLIAIGSGGIVGRGFGQSIQKFNYLPEPVGDSIFAVAAEEFGFLGTVVLIGLYIFFALRAFRIASAAESPYSGLLAVGITTFIVAQSFVNMGAMLGVLPLSGITLPFVSQGGTALFFTLCVSGMLLNISRKAKLRRMI